MPPAFTLTESLLIHINLLNPYLLWARTDNGSNDIARIINSI